MATMTATAIRHPTRTGMAARHHATNHIADDLAAFGVASDERANGADLDALMLYLDEVRRHPLLSAEEERALLAVVRAGTDATSDAASDADVRAARGRLCACNLRLVVSIAVRYRTVPGIDLLDLIQEGTIGLLHAIGTFNPARACRLSTHATWWIWQAISRAIGDQSRVVRLPIHVRTSRNTIRHTRRALAQSLLREPTADEIAAALAATRRTGTTYTPSAEQVRVIEAVVAPVLSLDMPVADDDAASSTLGSLLADDGGLSDAGALGVDPAELAVDAVTHAATVAWLLDPVMDAWAGAVVGWTNATTGEREMHMFEPLTPRERVVLALRYGLEEGNGPANGLDLLQTGKRLNLSRERVRQIQQTALDKLRVLAELIGLDAREVL